MAAVRPDPHTTLVGRRVSLRLLLETDLPALFRAIGKPEVFAGGWGGGAAAYRPDFGGWAAQLKEHLPFDTGNVYAVCLRADEDAVIGTTTLGQFDLRNESAHIGWTAYAPEAWGSGVNADAKHLLLATAFGHGFERVHLQADARNTRSRAAMDRLGARAEGVLRHTQRRADGTWRDTAVYSILREEWPAVEAGLLARLEGKASPSSS